MRKSNPPQKIGSIVESVLAERGYLTACREQEIITSWSSLVGSAVSEATECNRVENGIVYVRVLTAPWRQELAYLKQPLLDKIKKRFSSINNIVFY